MFDFGDNEYWNLVETAQNANSFPGKNGVENDLMMYKGFCPACGGAISRVETMCPTCRVSLTKPEPKRVAREIGIYLAFFVVVALAFVAIIKLRQIPIFAALLQGVLPFVIFLVLAFVVVRFWKRT